jgi:hypothetical protein
LTIVQTVALMVAFVLVSGLGGLLSAALVLPTVAVANGTTDMAVEAFDDLPTELVTAPLSERSVMLAADGTTVLATFWAENRVVVSLEQVSRPMQDAVVATEDRRFYQHGGIDPTGMIRAAVRNLTNPGRTEGASTLTQQYVKNVLIETAVRAGDLAGAEAAREADGADGYLRKLREAKLAISLEKTLTKDQILEAYLNIAQFGVNTYGVEAAAQRYFSTSAVNLNAVQAATIAGITQSPTRYDPLRNPEIAQERRDRVLRLMHEQGYLTSEELAAGLATPLAATLVPHEPVIGCMAAGSAVPGSGYFCDYVTKVIRSDPAFGETTEARVDRLYRGGLTITTTLDPREQAIADAEVKAGIPVDDPTGVATALVTVEPGTGRITSMAQNRGYNNTEQHGERETAVNYNADFAYGGASGFPPGSTFKPFTLAEWLQEGHNLNEVVNATRFSYTFGEFRAPCTTLTPRSTEYKFANAERDGRHARVGELGVHRDGLAAGPVRDHGHGRAPGDPQGRRGRRRGRTGPAARERAGHELDLAAVDGDGLRGVRERRHHLHPGRDLGGDRHRRQPAAGAGDVLHRRGGATGRERGDLRAEPRVARDRGHRRPAVRRGGQDRHDVAQRAHLVRRVHAAALDGRVGGLRRPDDPDAGRGDQRAVHPQRVRLVGGGADLEGLHDAHAGRRGGAGVRPAGQRRGVRQAGAGAVGGRPGRGGGDRGAGRGRVHGAGRSAGALGGAGRVGGDADALRGCHPGLAGDDRPVLGPAGRSGRGRTRTARRSAGHGPAGRPRS